MSRWWDVAVVGAGPSGSTLAALLASRGVRTVLIERHTLPRYKACGGGLTGRSLALLPPSARTAIRVWSPGAQIGFHGRLTEVGAGRPSVALCLRSELDHSLAEGARSAGADLLTPRAVTGAQALADGVRLQCGPDTVLARYLACADGATGPFSGPLGQAVGLTGHAPRIGALEVEIADPEGRWGPLLRGDFDVVPGGYGWVFPKGDSLSVGVASWRPGVGGAALRACLRRYVGQLGLTGPVLRGPVGHPIPVGGHLAAQGLVSPWALRVGDAAGMADPLFGEGIGYALEGAHQAAPVLVSALDGHRRPDALRMYAQAVRHGMYREFARADRLASVFYGHPAPWVAVGRILPAFGDAAWEWATAARRIPWADVAVPGPAHRDSMLR